MSINQLNIAIINPKGGSGKTTLTLNLAAGFAAQNYLVEIVDTNTEFSSLKTMCEQTEVPLCFNLRQLTAEAHYPSLANHSYLRQEQTSEKSVRLIDSASRTSDSLLYQILNDVDLVLVPFKTDRLTVDALVDFLYKLTNSASHLATHLKIRLLPHQEHLTKADSYLFLSQVQSFLEELPELRWLDIDIWPEMLSANSMFEQAIHQYRSHVFSNDGPQYKAAQHQIQGVVLRTQLEQNIHQ